jgi:hypothetical protein
MIGEARPMAAGEPALLQEAFALEAWHGAALSAHERAMIHDLAARFIAMGSAMRVTADEIATLEEAARALRAADAAFEAGPPPVVVRSRA